MLWNTWSEGTIEMRRAIAQASLIVLATVLANGQVVAANEAGWSRSEFVAKVERLWGQGDLEPEVLKLDRSDLHSRSCFANEDDTVWDLKAGPETVSGPLTRMALVGDGDSIHTISVYFPIVSAAGHSDTAIKVLNGIFQYLAPGWADASTWTETSLVESWEIVANVMDKRRTVTGPEEAFVEVDVGDLHLETFGVPPDFVQYGITVLDCDVLPRR
jgi:hypothetical protein